MKRPRSDVIVKRGKEPAIPAPPPVAVDRPPAPPRGRNGTLDGETRERAARALFNYFNPEGLNDDVEITDMRHAVDALSDAGLAVVSVPTFVHLLIERHDYEPSTMRTVHFAKRDADASARHRNDRERDPMTRFQVVTRRIRWPEAP